jgi:tetratricopeptide (TPR) repeat protein
MRKEAQALKAALKLAKDGVTAKALDLVVGLEADSLLTDELRTLALVHSYCGQEQDAEQVWARVCSRDDIGIGDCYMLGTTQLALGHKSEAIESLRRELAAADAKADSRYESISAINLAYLLSVRDLKDEALQVLQRLGDADGTYVHGVGQLTKRDLLARLQR